MQDKSTKSTRVDITLDRETAIHAVSLAARVEAVAQAAIDLDPDLPAANLVEKIIALADPVLLSDLDQILRARCFIQTIKSLRAKKARDSAPWLFPEIREVAVKLPARLPVGGKETVEKGEATYENLENYLKVLNQQNRKRHEKRTAAVKALMDLWPQRTNKTKWTTLAEVDAAQARKAGLI